MDIIKKINVNGCVNFYKLHKADEYDVNFYFDKCFVENNIVWKFYDSGWIDDNKADLIFDNERRINGAEFYLKFQIEDLALN